MNDIEADAAIPARTYRLPPELLTWLDEEAARSWRSRNSLVCEAVTMYRKLREDARQLADQPLPGQLPLAAAAAPAKPKRKPAAKPKAKARKGRRS